MKAHQQILHRHQHDMQWNPYSNQDVAWKNIVCEQHQWQYNNFFQGQGSPTRNNAGLELKAEQPVQTLRHCWIGLIRHIRSPRRHNFVDMHALPGGVHL